MKVIFFVGQDSGRPREADVTTMKLVLEACPEIGNTYGVILPKINEKMTKRLTDVKRVFDKVTDPDTDTDPDTNFLL